MNYNQRHATRDLTICCACRGSFVQPVQWEDLDGHHWEIDLRCPSCWNEETGRFDQATMDAYDTALDRGEAVLREALQKLTMENMADETERFVQALALDAVLPEDF